MANFHDKLHRCGSPELWHAEPIHSSTPEVVPMTINLPPTNSNLRPDLESISTQRHYYWYSVWRRISKCQRDFWMENRLSSPTVGTSSIPRRIRHNRWSTGSRQLNEERIGRVYSPLVTGHHIGLTVYLKWKGPCCFWDSYTLGQWKVHVEPWQRLCP
jgi:hypothetical protein